MALIGKLREKMGPILAIAIGFSLLAFVLGDILTSRTSLFRDSGNEMGIIAGESVSPQEFEFKFQENMGFQKAQSKTENLDAATVDNLREQTWNQIVNEKIFGKVYDHLGLTVSTDELWDMVQGRFVHPKILEVPAFKDSITGQFKPESVVKYLNSVPENAEAYHQWLQFEDGIKKERIAQKYLNMIKEGIYITKAEAEEAEIARTNQAKISFIGLMYRTVPDSTVKLSDSDLKTYYSKHEKEYEQEASRKLDYVTFDIAPSPEDYIATEKLAAGMVDDFKSAASDSEFVMHYSDNKTFSNSFTPKGELAPEIESKFAQLEKGNIIGPFFESNVYKLYKLIDKKEIPDSAKARHILLRFEGQDSATVIARADSIKKVIKSSKGKFADLASKFSQDPGSAMKGGDLGWFKEGAMVPAFNDACIYGKKGDLTVVQSQFGMHIIEVQDIAASSLRFKVAVVEKKAETSTTTDRNIFAKANSFVSTYPTSELFDKGITEMKLNKRNVETLKENDRSIPGLESSREVVRWAYQAKKGDISKVFQLGEKYVVAHLTGINEKGVAPFEDVKSRVETAARKEKKAKDFMDKINQNMSGVTTLEALAAKLGAQVQVADGFNFTVHAAQGIGNEPRVAGVLFSLKKGEMSKPVEGTSGVFVVVQNEIIAPEKVDWVSSKTTLKNGIKSRVDYQMLNALKEKAEIKDNRAKYF